jgi:hypothetical protein
MVGGRRGYSGGNLRWARKNPPVEIIAISFTFYGFHRIFAKPWWLKARGDLSLTTIEPAVIRDHKHNLPLEDVVIN